MLSMWQVATGSRMASTVTQSAQCLVELSAPGGGWGNEPGLHLDQRALKSWESPGVPSGGWVLQVVPGDLSLKSGSLGSIIEGAGLGG